MRLASFAYHQLVSIMRIVAWEEYGLEYWLRERQEDLWVGVQNSHRYMTENNIENGVNVQLSDIHVLLSACLHKCQPHQTKRSWDIRVVHIKPNVLECLFPTTIVISVINRSHVNEFPTFKICFSLNNARHIRPSKNEIWLCSFRWLVIECFKNLLKCNINLYPCLG